MDEREQVRDEILKNKQAIKPLVRHALEHLCYPSGLYTPSQWPWLEKLGIKSATTCKSGLNEKRTCPLELRRFLDGENIEHIVFEAELFGVLEIARKLRNAISLAR